jgi:hypothetical protein
LQFKVTGVLMDFIIVLLRRNNRIKWQNFNRLMILSSE